MMGNRKLKIFYLIFEYDFEWISTPIVNSWKGPFSTRPNKRLSINSKTIKPWRHFQDRLNLATSISSTICFLRLANRISVSKCHTAVRGLVNRSQSDSWLLRCPKTLWKSSSRNCMGSSIHVQRVVTHWLGQNSILNKIILRSSSKSRYMRFLWLMGSLSHFRNSNQNRQRRTLWAWKVLKST